MSSRCFKNKVSAFSVMNLSFVLSFFHINNEVFTKCKKKKTKGEENQRKNGQSVCSHDTVI